MDGRIVSRNGQLYSLGIDMAKRGNFTMLFDLINGGLGGACGRVFCVSGLFFRMGLSIGYGLVIATS